MKQKQSLKNDSTEYLESVKTLAKFYSREWGLSVIPVRVEKGKEKSPNLDSWTPYQKRIMTKEEIEKHKWQGIGIVCGAVSKLIVFDADTQEAVEFLEQFEPFRETTKVKTRRGMHYYFTVQDLPESFSKTKIDKDNIIIDIQANGSYVVAPPTTIVYQENGNGIQKVEYQWINDGNGYSRPFMELSLEQLTGLIKEIKEKLGITEQKQAKQQTVEKRGKIDLEKLKQVLSGYYSEGNRHLLCLYTAGFLGKNGIDQNDALIFISELAEENNDNEIKNRIRTVLDTYLKLQNNEEVKGYQGLVEEIGIPAEELDSCFIEQIIEITKRKSITIEDVANAISIVSKKLGYRIDYDAFFVKIFVNDKEITEKQELIIHEEVEKIFGKRVSKDLFYQGLSRFAYENERDRLKEFLIQCMEKWDGINRLESFFYDVFGVEKNVYTQTIAKNFFISAVARALDPGCFLKNILVIQGPQDYQKSRALAALGGHFHREINVSINTDKDFFLAIQGVWLAEIPEMEALRKADRNRVKAIISAKIDRFRPPYSRNMRDFPRRCVFVCTTNESEIFNDPTRGSRFWPVIVTKIADIEYIEKFREMLFGEAVYRYEKKEKYWETLPETKEQQEKFRKHDEWENIIANYIYDKKLTMTTVIDIATNVLMLAPKDLDKSKQMRIAECLQVLGFERKVVKEQGKTKRVWIKKQEQEQEQTDEIVIDDSIISPN